MSARPTKEQMAKVRRLKSEVSIPKSRLLDILRQIEEISPRQGAGLLRAIVALESWQNTRR